MKTKMAAKGQEEADGSRDGAVSPTFSYFSVTSTPRYWNILIGRLYMKNKMAAEEQNVSDGSSRDDEATGDQHSPVSLQLSVPEFYAPDIFVPEKYWPR
jgi:hypothetical protein